MRLAKISFVLLVSCGGDSSNVDGGTTNDAMTKLDAPAGDVVVVTDASLPHLTIDLASTSVSGISSGGFMAVQFHVAFSSIMKGAAIFAAGPYMCSNGSLATATTTCAQGSPASDIASLVATTKQFASSGAIDDWNGLASQRIFLFGGADDTVVKPAVVDATSAYYASFVPPSAIQYVSKRAGTSHTWPTLDYGNPCDVVSSPFLGKCSFDGAGQALAQIYGTLTPAATSASGRLVAIAQSAFVSNPASHSLGDTAYAYVPTSCAGGETCKVHVAFHGCLQSVDFVSDAFTTHSGLNEWADTNHIVVLYPQATKSGSNPEGCWDFWGYDSPDFAKKTAPQMAMVRAMIDAFGK